MTVSDDRLGLADPERTFTPRPDALVRASAQPRDARLRAPVRRRPTPTTCRVTCGPRRPARMPTTWPPRTRTAAWPSRPPPGGSRRRRSRRRTRCAPRWPVGCGDLVAADRDGETDRRPARRRPARRGRRCCCWPGASRSGWTWATWPRAEDLLAGLGGELPDGGSVLALRYARGRLYACSRPARRGPGRPVLLRRTAGRPPAPTARACCPGARRRPRSWPRPAPPRRPPGWSPRRSQLARRSGPASALGRALRIEGIVRPGAAGMRALRRGRPGPRAHRRAASSTPRPWSTSAIALNAARRRPQARRVLREAHGARRASAARRRWRPAPGDRLRAPQAASSDRRHGDPIALRRARRVRARRPGCSSAKAR